MYPHWEPSRKRVHFHKFTLKHAKVQRWSRGTVLLGSRWGRWFALPSGVTRHPLFRRLVGPEERSVRVRKTSPPLRQAHGESLYRLSYSDPPFLFILRTNFQLYKTFLFQLTTHIETLLYAVFIATEAVAKDRNK
jgi:hypothetical protein